MWSKVVGIVSGVMATDFTNVTRTLLTCPRHDSQACSAPYRDLLNQMVVENHATLTSDTPGLKIGVPTAQETGIFAYKGPMSCGT
ncbi:hypothetical protein SNOG_08230 [Parastagonospora nodorum SN15]|uniref:Uncharacterized protein n=1 Tax=Phaeosphaeria nodorum (strain SN15 / ATCC MYA-4574 / FGSC 10173) TaxID=321614 RepID=Q0UJ34_PHANO|nr:hypothetical protein SNOG_08230 [Parastagonospora nodorum SN15]EAT84506.1 hypothetical protein SNOG_08230 [Parastagonospora nodorum SN15]